NGMARWKSCLRLAGEVLKREKEKGGKKTPEIEITTIAAVMLATMLLTAIPAQAQLPKDPEERKKVIAQIMEANARQLTLFDREGKPVEQVGPKDLYNQPVLSPDRKRLAVVKTDLEK